MSTFHMEDSGEGSGCRKSETDWYFATRCLGALVGVGVAIPAVWKSRPKDDPAVNSLA